MSSVPLQGSVAAIRKQLRAIAPLKVVHLTGPGDPKSKYGGIFFYGIHQADLMVELFGPEARSVASMLNGSGGDSTAAAAVMPRIA